MGSQGPALYRYSHCLSSAVKVESALDIVLCSQLVKARVAVHIVVQDIEAILEQAPALGGQVVVAKHSSGKQRTGLPAHRPALS